MHTYLQSFYLQQIPFQILDLYMQALCIRNSVRSQGSWEQDTGETILLISNTKYKILGFV